MPNETSTFAARLRALEDREAIRELIAGYGPLADTGDAAGVAALWQDDGSHAVGGMEESVGRNAIAALIDGPIHRQLMADGCAHILSPVAIDLDGDRAMARGYSCVFRWTGESWQAARVSANRWELARGTMGWEVVRRDNALLNGDQAALSLLTPPTARHQR
jgi:uncharacterized protein (TIGR02246 family)